MKGKKLSLANMQGKLSRLEMKNIMAGNQGETCNCNSADSCPKDKSYCVRCDGSQQYAGVCHSEPAV